MTDSQPAPRFTNGACHIYAMALQERFPQLTLRRAGIKAPTSQQSPQGIHVYAVDADGTMFHSDGSCDEKAFLRLVKKLKDLGKDRGKRGL